jgi:hypothetical protein
MNSFRITLLFLILICSLFGCISGKESKTHILQEMCKMTDEECLQELERMGFEDIGVYDTREKTAEAAKAIVMFYSDGGTPESVPFSYTGMVEMAQNIWKVLGD